jgi:hypothetical protein
MKISINQDDSFQLEQFYLPITLVSDNKEEISICLRDGGFEFKYQGDLYAAKNGKVELMKKQLCDVSNDLSTNTNLYAVGFNSQTGEVRMTD